MSPFKRRCDEALLLDEEVGRELLAWMTKGGRASALVEACTTPPEIVEAILFGVVTVEREEVQYGKQTRKQAESQRGNIRCIF